MSKFINVEMVDADVASAFDARNMGVSVSDDDVDKKADGYVVRRGNSITWIPKEIFEVTHFKLENKDGDSLSQDDINRFVKNKTSVKVGSKTVNTTLECITGYEVHGQSSCVNPDNFSLEIGEEYATPHAEDKIWEGLGFALQWAKFGLKK